MSQLSKADLHIHTIHSDGAPSVPELLAYVAEKTDLRLIAITDHDSIAGARQAAQLAGEFGIGVVMGEEVSTADGHLLALFIDSFIPPGHSATETIAAVHAQGGLAIAAHPFDRSVPSLGRATPRRVAGGLAHPGWRLDAVEGFNAGVIWSQRGSNRAARAAAEALDLPVVGGSDAHTLATVGQGYTHFPGTSADDLYRAIKCGEVGWGGSYWSLQQYIDMGRQLLRQHGLRGSLNLVALGTGLHAQQKTSEVV